MALDVIDRGTFDLGWGAFSKNSMGCQLMVGVAAILFAAFSALPTFDGELHIVSLTKDDYLPEAVDHGLYERTDEFFTSENVRCHTWLYLPKEGPLAEPSPPVVILGHGLGAQKDMGLDTYAAAFAKEGIASFVIDYRTFGASDGMPRNLINPWSHVQDFHSAISHIQTDGLGGRVDSSRIALWGTSLGGGHVIEAAATQKSNITAVVSQVPHLDGRAASKRAMSLRGVLGTLRLAYAVLKDSARHFMGRSPAYISIAGELGSLSLMPLRTKELVARKAKHPDRYLGGWQDLAPARVGGMMSFYSPIRQVGSIEAPILFIAASRDELCPLDTVKEAASKAKDARFMEVDADHFEVYGGEVLERTLKETTAFLVKQLSQ